MKKILDISGAVFGLILLAPFVPLIGLAIKLETRGPMFVGLTRVSGGKPIVVYKFRSMVHDATALKSGLVHLNERRDGPFFKIANDPRITRVGKIIRKFRIDEFPQLWNVAKGELSLVGPRPHEPNEVIHYPEPYKHLMLAKAGVTGLSQVNGASSLPFLKELQLDHYYVRHASIAFDIRIIGKTLKIIFTDPTAV